MNKIWTRALVTAAASTVATIALAAPPAHASAVPGAADPHDLGSSLKAGHKLMSGDYLAAGKYRALMRADGNFVVTKNGTELFQSRTYGYKGAHAEMYKGGNFSVIDRKGKTIWHTLTRGTGADQLVLRTSGNLVLLKGKTLEWATYTDHGNQMHDATVYAEAIKYLGKYEYGGGGHDAKPGPSDGGTLDCSGYVRWMYYLASGKDKLDGTAKEQFAIVGGKVGSTTHQNRYGAPGSLVFYYGTDGEKGGPVYIHHVGIYIGGGRIINEFNGGDKIQVNKIGDSIGKVYAFYNVPAWS